MLKTARDWKLIFHERHRVTPESLTWFKGLARKAVLALEVGREYLNLTSEKAKLAEKNPDAIGTPESFPPSKAG